MAIQHRRQSEMEALQSQNRDSNPHLSDQKVAMFGSSRHSDIIARLGNGPRADSAWSAFINNSTNKSSITTKLGEERLNFHLSNKYIIQYIRSLNPDFYCPLNEPSGTATVNYGSSGITGTVSNTTVGQAGQAGRAYSFDGNGDRVIFSNFFPSVTYSFVCVFKRVGAPDLNDRILDQAAGGPTKGWHLQLGTDGAVGLRTWNDSGAQLSLDYGIAPDGEWCVLGGSIGASSSKIYLNGVEVATGAGNSFGTGIASDLQLGCRSGGTSNPMTGFLQHVAIKNGVEWSAAVHQKIAFFLV